MRALPYADQAAYKANVDRHLDALARDGNLYTADWGTMHTNFAPPPSALHQPPPGYAAPAIHTIKPVFQLEALHVPSAANPLMASMPPFEHSDRHEPRDDGGERGRRRRDSHDDDGRGRYRHGDGDRRRVDRDEYCDSRTQQRRDDDRRYDDDRQYDDRRQSPRRSPPQRSLPQREDAPGAARAVDVLGPNFDASTYRRVLKKCSGRGIEFSMEFLAIVFGKNVVAGDAAYAEFLSRASSANRAEKFSRADYDNWAWSKLVLYRSAADVKLSGGAMQSLAANDRVNAMMAAADRVLAQQQYGGDTGAYADDDADSLASVATARLKATPVCRYWDTKQGCLKPKCPFLHCSKHQLAASLKRRETRESAARYSDAAAPLAAQPANRAASALATSTVSPVPPALPAGPSGASDPAMVRLQHALEQEACFAALCENVKAWGGPLTLDDTKATQHQLAAATSVGLSCAYDPVINVTTLYAAFVPASATLAEAERITDAVWTACWQFAVPLAPSGFGRASALLASVAAALAPLPCPPHIVPFAEVCRRCVHMAATEFDAAVANGTQPWLAVRFARVGIGNLRRRLQPAAPTVMGGSLTYEERLRDDHEIVDPTAE
jgi:hypothetical protein